MKEFIEKLIGRLEENGQKMCEAKSSVPYGKHSPSNHRYYKAISVKKAIHIVNQLAEEYKTCYKSCTECEAYDKEKHYCPKFCYIIAETVKEIEENQNNDFCEWHKVKNGNAYKCNTHAEIHDSRVLDWCVCPYCGKKIKVVK